VNTLDIRLLQVEYKLLTGIGHKQLVRKKGEMGVVMDYWVDTYACKVNRYISKQFLWIKNITGDSTLKNCK
jgi:hypothetical protein